MIEGVAVVREFVFIYDYICPYCYLMFKEIRKLKQIQNININWVPVEMFPEIPIEGIIFEKYIGVQQNYRMKKKISELAEEKNIPYYHPQKLYNTNLAGLLTDFVSIKTNNIKTEEIVEELFNRVFIYNENIRDLEILRKVCINLALDSEKFKQDINQPYLKNFNLEWKSQYNKRLIEVIPTLIIDRATEVQGLYTYKELEKMIK